jgi:NAD(P)-dependent dehydrogenase (short-subunit alcohol dehydrogenase family)
VNKIIALTGANGFMGKIIRKDLEVCGHKVIAVRTDGDLLELYQKGIQCLIHCARHHEYLTEPITEAKWIGEYLTDVYYPYNYTMKMVNASPELNNVIIITSIYGVKPPTVRYIPPNYCMAKAAERQMIKELAVRLAPNIRVNGIIYGGVYSDREAAAQNETFRAKYNKKTLLGHMVMPEEVAGAVKFLVSDESKGMTGSEIFVTGGYGLD